MITAPLKPITAETILSKVEPVPEAGCWLWTGALSDDGYGRIYRRPDHGQPTKRLLAHRVSYSVFVGDPAGKSVLHRCDTACCVNPAHLYLGTQADNVRDRVVRGRDGSAKKQGELSKNAKLTDNQVREIRAWKGPVQEALRRFGIGRTQYYRIINGKVWKHL